MEFACMAVSIIAAINLNPTISHALTNVQVDAGVDYTEYAVSEKETVYGWGYNAVW
jgi:hypothetical protein